MNKVILLSKFARLYVLAAKGLVHSVSEAASILGVTLPITPEELKKAFRAKAVKAHPDVNPNGELEMKLLNAARELLLSFSKKNTPPFREGMNFCYRKI